MSTPSFQVQRLFDRLLDLVFPPRCASCQQTGTWLCDACREQITPIRPPICSRCGRPLTRPVSDVVSLCLACRHAPPTLDGIRSVAFFEGPLRLAIHRFKYRNGQPLAEPLGQLLADYLNQNHLPADVIVPVPLHPNRLHERGYNQSALLARHLGRVTGLLVVEGCLRRVKATAPQIDLTAAQRRENVAGAFDCIDDRLAGRHVLLIDDVYTTGATLEACAAAVRAHGARSVWALTLAHGR
jgi:ComF family protein